MNKSHLSRTDNPTAVVTSQDVGSFVSVSGVGKGVLHYVGEVHGKEGLYCGIELETPTGKHDGTYQGIVYFVCPPRHGIFAPLYRVELDEIDDVPMMAASQTAKGQERLSRSALPALQLRNVFRPSEDPMQTSVASEQFMEGSTFSNASWGDGDAMVCSNATYILPPGRSALLENEECDLMSITAPKSILSYRRERSVPDEEVTLGTSVVLDESRVGVENLPVVEDDDNDDVDDEDDDLQTPLVEAPPPWQPLSSFAPPPSIMESLGSPSSTEQSTTKEKEPSLRANSRQSDDTGYNGESDASRLEHDDLPLSTPNAKESADKEAKHSPRPSRRTMEKLQEPPPPPKFPVKPKPPSKHQLLMEQIKASIEADKLKPKKEIKARVSLLPPPRAPPVAQQNENTTEEKMSESPRRSPKQPLKAVNAAPPKPAVERPKKERKPLYVPPPPKERKIVKTSTPNVKNGDKNIDTPNVSKIEETPTKAPAKGGKTQFPTSSFAGGKPANGSKSRNLNTKAGSTEISKEEKLQRLRRAARACDALCIVISKTELESARMRSQLEEANEQIARQAEHVEELRSHLSQREKLHLEDVERHKAHSEQVTRSHTEALERLKERYERQLAEKTKESERALEDERSRHEAELEAMSRRHQKVVISMDEKIAESEKIIVQLTADKKALQTALANDSDQRNQMLTKEINSLQTALEFKSNEMKELRQKYQQVALRVEEIPVKELEITKLKHKVIELKQALDQKLTYEKMLVHQNEELKRQQLAIEEERESMQRNFDVMVYRYETGDEIVEQCSPASRQKPGKVQFRSRSSNSDRPNSNARLSQASFSEMDRSTDRDSLTRSTVSMYASQVQLPDNHADDVIYAPDEIITSSSLRRHQDDSFSDCSDEKDRGENGNIRHCQADSGIGL
ncbi:hypothetical protein Q1695_015024 [Nippostrongylus brasiliensis]|nr:hypothetical protein Q1695_015024 [Nippostrongylus brasiliensis]